MEISAVNNNASDDASESTDEISTDLSMLTSLTKPNANLTFVLLLPTSLRSFEIVHENDFDFSALTNLTLLVLWLRSDVHIVFPTQMGTLVIMEGRLGTSNIADVALKGFQSDCDVPLTLEKHTALPKTITQIKGTFESKWLVQQRREIFPCTKATKCTCEFAPQMC